MNIEAYNLDLLRKLVRELQRKKHSISRPLHSYSPGAVRMDDSRAAGFYGSGVGGTACTYPLFMCRPGHRGVVVDMAVMRRLSSVT